MGKLRPFLIISLLLFGALWLIGLKVVISTFQGNQLRVDRVAIEKGFFEISNPDNDLIKFWGCESFSIAGIPAERLPDHGDVDCPTAGPGGFVWELEHYFSDGIYEAQVVSYIQTTYPEDGMATISTPSDKRDKVFALTMQAFITISCIFGVVLALDIDRRNYEKSTAVNATRPARRKPSVRKTSKTK